MITYNFGVRVKLVGGCSIEGGRNRTGAGGKR
jgi:hypothetical protein